MNKLTLEAAKVLKKILYINIASITPEGEPWNTPVYCAYDSKLNYYWLSWKDNQHSINVRNNPKVFITSYDSTVPASTGFGVYLKGEAKELKNPKDMLIAITEVYKREKRKPRQVAEFLKKFPRRIYKFTPNQVWVNGDAKIDGNFIDVRTELNLDELREAIKK
ncbi:pyridoxamine 5'-phosphate oxidase family protein [Candidatus Woesebacteria bacterium]|nr:pyridoxamine 5'-phosphate oxidase family protein [Candidatus Woesebacteria bacterium]